MSAPLATYREARWPQYGRPASPVKAGLRPPPLAAGGLDRTCWPPFVGHQAFDGEVRLMRPPNQAVNLTETRVHKKMTLPERFSA